MERIILPAKLENLEKMMDFIRDGAEKQGFSSKKINQILVATEEPIVNVISYAYPDKDGNLEITYDNMGEKGLMIEIIDWGIPFDPLSVKPPNIEAPLEERKIGGLGIHIMRQIMDNVKYRREGDRNILYIVKH